ncbi:MAG TPA: RNA polymerase sigma factor [Candidatus Dormibacteraeota bacterium]|nr:RNA polymerase sigma factor [Candidatus Dormibacteraeota bacterium]
MPEEEAAVEPVYTPGSAEDFARLYTRSYRRILITLIGMLGDPAAAEDCTQEAFVRAFKAWATWRPGAPAEAWLHRIAINVAVSHWRRQRLREVGEIIKRIGRPPAPPSPALIAENTELGRALRRIPAKQAAAIVLRHYHGYTNREIAAALGIPERTVASRLAAAKVRLKVELADWRE